MFYSSWVTDLLLLPIFGKNPELDSYYNLGFYLYVLFLNNLKSNFKSFYYTLICLTLEFLFHVNLLYIQLNFTLSRPPQRKI